MKMLSIRNIQCQFLFGVKPRLAILWDLLQQFQVLLCICMSMWEKEVVVLVQFMLNSTRLSCKCLLTVSLILLTFWITCRIVVISVPTSQSIVPFPQNLSMCFHWPVGARNRFLESICACWWTGNTQPAVRTLGFQCLFHTVHRNSILSLFAVKFSNDIAEVWPWRTTKMAAFTWNEGANTKVKASSGMVQWLKVSHSYSWVLQ